MDGQDQTTPARTGKPLHIFCVLAAIVFLMYAAQDALVIEVRELANSAVGSHLINGVIVWQSITGLAGCAAEYGGLALAVELIDRIRWSMLPEAERTKQRSRYILIRMFRLANADL